MNTDDTSLRRPGYWFGVIEYRLREKMRETFTDLDLSRGEWRILHAIADGPKSVDDIEAALPPGDRHRRMGARASGRPGHGYGPWAWGGFGPGYGGGRGYGPWTWAGRGYGPGSWPGFGPAFGPGYGRWFGRGFAPGEGDAGASEGAGTEAGSNTSSSAGAESSSGTASGSAAASGSGSASGPGSAEAGPDAHAEQAGHNGPDAHAEHTGHDWRGRYGWHPGHHGPDAHHGHEAHDRHGADSADRPEHGDRREHRRPRSVAEVLVDFTERGWVVLDDTGATLTDAGRAVHDEAQSRVKELRASVTEGISEDDYRTMMATLEKMARNVGWSEEAEGNEAADDEAAASDQTQADGDAPEAKPDAEA